MAVPRPPARCGRRSGWHARSYRRALARLRSPRVAPQPDLLPASRSASCSATSSTNANPDLGGLTYLEFVAPGAARDALAMQIGANDGDVPGHGGPELAADVPRGRGHSRPRRRARRRDPRLGGGRGSLVAVSLFAVVAAIGRGVRLPARGARRRSRRCSAGSRSRRRCSRRSPRRVESHEWLTAVFRFALLPHLPLLGDVLPRSTSFRAGSSRSPGRRRSGTASTLCREPRHGQVDAAATIGHVAYLVAFDRRGVRARRPGTAGEAARDEHAATPLCASSRVCTAALAGVSSTGTSRLARCLARSSSPASSSRSSSSSRIGVGVGALVGDVELRRPGRRLQRVRRAGDARGLGDERRRLRVDDQRLLQAEVREDLRRSARHADGRPRRRDWAS